MGSCSDSLKYALVAFNLTCAVAGVAIITVGFMANYHGGRLRYTLTGQITTVSICLTIIGSVVFLVAFFGCCGTLREDTCMIRTYGIILLIVLLFQIALGIAAFLLKPRVDSDLEDKFGKFLQRYDKYKQYIDDIQSTLKCCGYDGPTYWDRLNVPIPDTCCPEDRDCNAQNSYSRGCYRAVKNLTNIILNVIGGVSIGIALIELMVMICAFHVASSIQRADKRGYW